MTMECFTLEFPPLRWSAQASASPDAVSFGSSDLRGLKENIVSLMCETQPEMFSSLTIDGIVARHMVHAKIIVVLVDFSEFLSRTKRRVHLQCLIEPGIVDLVTLSILIISDHRVEAMTPQNFSVQVTGPGLGALTSRLDRSLEDNDDFKAILQYIRRRQIIQRRFGSDLVNHDHRPNEEQVRATTVGSHF